MKKSIKYSQNLLVDSKLIEQLVSRSSITKNNTVLEIGAGSGIITKELVKNAGEVTAFEIDEEYVKTLREITDSNLGIVFGNFLDYDLPESPYKVFSNIPFNKTSEIIKKLCFSDNPPSDTYLVVQKESAQKFSGKPIDNKNSLVSILLRPWFDFDIGYIFKRSDFKPKPNVDSVLLQIKKVDNSKIANKDRGLYRDFIVFSFGQFAPNILEGLSKVLGKQQMLNLAKNENFSVEKKPSEINFENWLDLFKLFLNLPQNKQAKIKNSYEKWIKQQENIDKIHRTRKDRNWKKYL